MPRKQVVTRKLKGVKAKVLQLDLKAETVFEKELFIAGSYKTVYNLLKALQRTYDTKTVKVMKVISFESVNKLYGMTAEDFYTKAVEYDIETRKPITE